MLKSNDIFKKKAKINHCHENKKLYKASQFDKLYQ